MSAGRRAPASPEAAPVIPWIEEGQPLPSPERALKDPNGLLAASSSLSVPRLLEAYGKGIFPWFGEDDPVLWWSPNPRMVLFPAEIKVSRSLAKRLKKHDYDVRFDTAFDAVVAACAAPRPGAAGTWITPAIAQAYGELFRLGFAHSVETWIGGELAGGLYGVALGRVFYGESMFARVTDASKIAFVNLVRRLQRHDFGLVDCQMRTAHLASLGAREIPRREFSALLKALVNYREPGHWRGENFSRDAHSTGR